MKVLLICGSTAHVSHTRTLSRVLETYLRKQDVSTLFWDLRDEPLPIAIPEYHWSTHTHPDPVVRDFVEQVVSADALALASPLYHGSYSGVLKNALDNLGFDAFRNKAVALLSHGSNIRMCAQPCEHLGSVVRTLYGYSTQTIVSTTNTDFQSNEEGYELVNPEILDRLHRQATELVQLTRNRIY